MDICFVQSYKMMTAASSRQTLCLQLIQIKVQKDGPISLSLSLSLSLSHTHTPSHTHTISAASKPFLIPSLLWHLLNLTQLTHSLSLSCTIYLFYFCLSCLCVWLHLPTSFSLSFTIIELNLQKSHFSLAATIMLNQHLSNPFLSLSCFILELCLYLIFV